MKKILFAIVLSVVYVVQINAQNIQLHYDFGGDLYDELGTRPSLTTTVEMFKPDKWGSTFFFVDMDYAKMKWLRPIGNWLENLNFGRLQSLCM